jgi:hypothetical protein
VTGGPAPAIRQELIERIEAHCVLAWPAQVIQREPDGWILRATPGLRGRGRSNHALAPARSLSTGEIDSAPVSAAAFAELNGTECGIQVGPLEFHIPLLDDVAVRGWEIQQSVLVMTAATRVVSGSEAAALEAGSAESSSPLTYLQMLGGNDAGLALYKSLGFAEVYRYCHCLAPVA